MHNDSLSSVSEARSINATDAVSTSARYCLTGVLLLAISACDDLGHDHDHDSSASPDAQIEYGDEYWASLAQNYAPFEKPDPPL